MTNPEKLDELEARYLIVKRGLYYRPDNKGYTGLKKDAGRYPKEHANAAYGTTAIHEDDAPEYSEACWPETKLADKDETIRTLRERNAALVNAAWAMLALETARAKARGLADCCCIQWSRDTERAYENGTCPHQLAVKTISLIEGTDNG